MPRQARRVVVFPSDDSVLSHDVHEAIARVPDALPDELARAAAQRELRRWYRALTIHERDPFGAYPDDPAVVWYVYRDGRVRRPNPPLERLYEALAVARTPCDDSERALADARVAARSAGYADAAPPAAGFEPVSARRPRPRP